MHNYRVINTVVSEPYVNFTLYSKECECSEDSCSSEIDTKDIDELSISNVTELDSKT